MTADIIRTCPQGHVEKRTINKRGRVEGCHACMVNRKRAERLRNNALPPDTEATFSAYKEPLTASPTGFGYLGCIAYDKNETHTQCHICGWFFKSVGHHVNQQHDISTEEYRERFGLIRGKSLVATNTRKNYLRRWQELSPEERQRRIKELKNTAGRNHGVNRAKPKSLEKKNLEGTCPDQLLDKILKLKEKLGHTPTKTEFEREYRRDTKIVGRTFGSWTESLRVLGMSPRIGGHPAYSEETVLKMLRDFAKEYGREPYYRDVRHGHLPRSSVYIRLFGSWSKAKEIAFPEGDPSNGR